MKTFLPFISAALLTTSTMAQHSTSYQTEDTAGSVLKIQAGFPFFNITGTWSYPKSLVNPSGEPGTFFYTQYVAFDLLPNTCDNSLQVGTNITLDSPDPDNNNGTRGGFGFYTLNNETTIIKDGDGNAVQFLDGHTVTVTVVNKDSFASVIYNSTSSGVIRFNVPLHGKRLCSRSVQWTIGSAPQEYGSGPQEHLPRLDDLIRFEDCKADYRTPDGQYGTATPELGSRVNLMMPVNNRYENRMRAETEPGLEDCGYDFWIEYQFPMHVDTEY